MAFYDDLNELDKILEETNTPMAINERAKKIVEAFMLPGDVSAMITFVAGELRAVQEEWVEKYADMMRQRDAARTIAFEQAAEIADKDHECPTFCRVCKIVDHIREEASK